MLGEKILGGEKKMSKRAKKVLQVSKVEKKVMREELERFRECWKTFSMPMRLRLVPISYYERLFCQENEEYWPCEFFGRQLVLKIIDELLD